MSADGPIALIDRSPRIRRVATSVRRASIALVHAGCGPRPRPDRRDFLDLRFAPRATPEFSRAPIKYAYCHGVN